MATARPACIWLCALLGAGQLAGSAIAAEDEQPAAETESSYRPVTGSLDVPKLDATGVTPQGRRLGLGFSVGFPTSVDGRLQITDRFGVQGGVGYSAGWVVEPTLSLHLDAIWTPDLLARGEHFKLSWYVGGGVWTAGVVDNVWFSPFPMLGARPSVLGVYWWRGPQPAIFGALRAPVGMALAVVEFPLEMFVEVAPSVLVVPAVAAGLGGRLGLRWYL